MQSKYSTTPTYLVSEFLGKAVTCKLKTQQKPNIFGQVREFKNKNHNWVLEDNKSIHRKLLDTLEWEMRAIHKDLNLSVTETLHLKFML